LDLNVTAPDAVKLILEAWNADNYYATAAYFQPIKQYLDEKESLHLIDLDMPSLDHSFKGLHLSDAALLLALGPMAYARSGQITQAAADLQYLEGFVSDIEQVAARGEEDPSTSLSWREEAVRARTIYLGALAEIRLAQDRHGEALAEVDQALALDKTTADFADAKYTNWLRFIRFRVLLDQERYEEAEMLSRTLRRTQMMDFGESSLFDKSEVRYLLALSRFKQGKYQAALIGLRMLQKNDGDRPKYFALERDIHLKRGDEAAAAAADTRYQELLKDNS
jgi:predicted Zn-dependent protease